MSSSRGDFLLLLLVVDSCGAGSFVRSFARSMDCFGNVLRSRKRAFCCSCCCCSCCCCCRWCYDRSSPAVGGRCDDDDDDDDSLSSTKNGASFDDDSDDESSLSVSIPVPSTTAYFPSSSTFEFRSFSASRSVFSTSFVVEGSMVSEEEGSTTVFSTSSSSSVVELTPLTLSRRTCGGMDALALPCLATEADCGTKPSALHASAAPIKNALYTTEDTRIVVVSADY
mmetsp:Transcript_18783/g.43487  ORF Transcript_18783/g.43487 Transcript_18783/m.43487 type:complete len:226 (+) Transcript_18783:491-1168(+)